MELITAKAESHGLTLFAHGRIDTNTVGEAEKQLDAILAQHNCDEVIMDVEDLVYISSAGLRMVLRLRKNKPQLRIINASPEVYDIFDMTGFSEMIPIEKAYRQMSVDGCSIVGRGAKGTVYRFNGDTVIKVYNNPDCLPEIQRERELARKAFVLGIPTAISYDVVKVGDKFGSVFELLDAKSFAQLIAEQPEKIDFFVSEYAALLRQIHETEVNAEDMPDAKNLVFKWLETDSKLLSEDDYHKLEELVKELPDRMNMIHNDYHMNNLMLQNGETLLIDMDTLAHGHPIIELANIYITYVLFSTINPKMTEDFFGFPAQTAQLLWKKFLPLYLQTEDAERIESVEEKVKLLSCARLLRHFARRDPEQEDAKKAIAFALSEMPVLLNKLETLDF